LDKPAEVAKTNQPGLYTVTKFSDGDTIEVDMNGHRETIRFIGVDTPETHRPNSPVQCYGPEASAYTKTLIGSSSVRLQADPLDTNRDRYGRLLRYVYLPDGTLVEDKLISEGYAFAYTQFPFQKKAAFQALEDTAKQAGKGLWGACQVTVEASGREQTQAQ
jgi:micrococcal nuclease